MLIIICIQLCKRLAKTLEQTRFSGAHIVSVAAKPGGVEDTSSSAVGVDKLIEVVILCAVSVMVDDTNCNVLHRSCQRVLLFLTGILMDHLWSVWTTASLFVVRGPS